MIEKARPGGRSNPRRASMRRCNKCGRMTFQGWDGDVMAGFAIVDVTPLDPMGELVAVTAEIPTYDLAWRDERYVLDYRTSLHIGADPAGSRARVDVVPAHRCGVRIRETLPLTLRGVPIPRDDSLPPPF